MDTKKTKDDKSDVLPVEKKEEETMCNCEDDCQKECEKHKIESEEWKNKYLRALADYHNLEKRTLEQVEALQARTKKNLLHKFLEVLDTLYQAEVFIKDKGLVMVMDNFKKAIKDEGVEEMQLVGQEYDP